MYARFLSTALLSAFLCAPVADAAAAKSESRPLATRVAKGGKASRQANRIKQRKVKKPEAQAQLAEASLPPESRSASPADHPRAYELFKQKLQQQVEKNVYDYCPPLAVALNATGNEFAALQWMEQAAAEGNAAALLYIADNDLADAPSDRLLTPRLRKAYERVRKAADKGYAPAQCTVYGCLRYGIGVRKDEAAADKYLRNACRSGNFIPRLLWLQQENRLASFDDRERPEVKAEVERGNYHVIYYLAELATQPADRVDWMRRAALKGSPEAHHILSILESAGGRHKESYELLQRAAALHCPDSICALGTMLLGPDTNAAMEALGIKPDRPTALHFLRLASMMRQSKATYLLGRGYYYGEYDLPVNREYAYRHFAAGALQKDGPCMAAAGLMLLKGDGVAQDTRKGLRYVTLAANSRYAYGIVLLAYAHYRGLGVPADANRAAELLKDAALHGYARAYVDLAYICAKGGAGMEPDPTMSQTYLRMASFDLREKADEYYRQLEKAGEWEPAP